MMGSKKWKTRWKETGGVFVLTALAVPFFLGCVGLAIDVGNLYMHKSRLQNAADAAALKGGWVYAENNESVSSHPEANKAAKEYVVLDMAPNGNAVALAEEKYQAQSAEGVTYYRVALTEDVPLFFLKVLLNQETQAVSADSVVAIASGGAQLDEMFNFAMCAAHKSDKNYDMTAWNSSDDCSIWFHTDDVHIKGDIMTNGKIMFDNSRRTTLDGILNAFTDVKSSGKQITQEYWQTIDGKNVYVTKNIDPSVWGKYNWQDGKQEAFTFVDADGNSFINESMSTPTLASNGWQWLATATEADSSNVAFRDEIDISIPKNEHIREFIENVKNLSYADRETKHVYYDDSNSGYNFSSSNDTSHFPALCPHGGTIVPDDATSIPVWDRWYNTVIVGGDIQVSFEKSPAPGDDDSAMIVSMNGNIHIPNSVNFNGILYAPNGTVTIDGNSKVSGSIVAQKILITTGGQQVDAKSGISSRSSTSYSTSPSVKLAAAKNLSWD
ncbi:MAG: Tad domain-containing protein [Schwartzia sp.]|nr:Tad domain-containing protein [Schwartzia sp. (in: firmicutes)]